MKGLGKKVWVGWIDRKWSFPVLINEEQKCCRHVLRTPCHLRHKQKLWPLSSEGEMVKLEQCAVGLASPTLLLAQWHRAWAYLWLWGNGVIWDTQSFWFLLILMTVHLCSYHGPAQEWITPGITSFLSYYYFFNLHNKNYMRCTTEPEKIRIAQWMESSRAWCSVGWGPKIFIRLINNPLPVDQSYSLDVPFKTMGKLWIFP